MIEAESGVPPVAHGFATEDPTGLEVVLPAGTTVGYRAVVADRVAVGRDVTVMAGAYVGPGTRLGDRVMVGPRAALVAASSTGPRSDTGIVVGEGASIGAGATVFHGVSIGAGAVVGPGAVVHDDVPPRAIVGGTPGVVVGYVSLPTVEADTVVRASSLATGELPRPLGRATLVGLPEITDPRGSLVFAEVGDRLPFTVQRFFFVHRVPDRKVRGEHAHRELHEFLLCLQGTCRVTVDDGEDGGEVVLDSPLVGVHLPPMVWSTQYDFSPDALVLVLASALYDDADYIRDHAEFLHAVRGG